MRTSPADWPSSQRIETKRSIDCGFARANRVRRLPASRTTRLCSFVQERGPSCRRGRRAVRHRAGIPLGDRSCERLLADQLPAPLRDLFSDVEKLEETGVAHSAVFALEYAVACAWRAWGIEPAMVAGQGLGAYVVACVAGVFSLEDALHLVYARATLMRGSTTSRLPDSSLPAFRAALESATFHAPRMRLVANVSGDQTGANIATPAYWLSLERQPGPFAESMAALAAGAASDAGSAAPCALIEIGPPQSLLTPAAATWGGQALWLPSLTSTRDEFRQMLDSAARLYEAGHDLHWPASPKDEPHRGCLRRPTRSSANATGPTARQSYVSGCARSRGRPSASAAVDKTRRDRDRPAAERSHASLRRHVLQRLGSSDAIGQLPPRARGRAFRRRRRAFERLDSGAAFHEVRQPLSQSGHTACGHCAGNLARPPHGRQRRHAAAQPASADRRVVGGRQSLERTRRDVVRVRLESGRFRAESARLRRPSRGAVPRDRGRATALARRDDRGDGGTGEAGRSARTRRRSNGSFRCG